MQRPELRAAASHEAHMDDHRGGGRAAELQVVPISVRAAPSQLTRQPLGVTAESEDTMPDHRGSDPIYVMGRSADETLRLQSARNSSNR
jgi:hypothetical protein